MFEGSKVICVLDATATVFLYFVSFIVFICILLNLMRCVRQRNKGVQSATGVEYRCTLI